MRSEKVLHFIYGDLAYKNFLHPLIQFNENTFLSQDVVIGGNSIDKSFKLMKDKGLHFGYNFKLTSFRINFYKIFRLILKKSPSIVIAHMSLCATYPLLISKILKVEKRIYICHGAPYLGYGGVLRLILKIIEKFNISLSTLTICVSPSIQYELRKIAKKSHIVSTSPGSCSGLPYEKYLSKDGVYNKFENQRDELKVLYIGRANRRKGVYDLLGAANSKSILERKISIDVVGIDLSELSINLKNLPVNVRFHGFQLDLSSFYLDNDIVILPSWHEGFGYALLEGAAFGCAMIASKIPGPDSIVINNVNGSLIPARSQRGIEECILNYYNDRDMLLNHMKNAYIRSLDFEENKILAQMTDFLTNNQYRT